MSKVIEPKPIRAGMPNRDAQDPPVDAIALRAARLIEEQLPAQMKRDSQQRVTFIQLAITRAVDEALDRMQRLGGRRVK